MSKKKLVQICTEKGLNIENYDLNENTGLIRNTCMSPKCIYYMQPLKHKEIHDHLKLWRGQVPVRFHLTVVNNLKQKKHPE